MKLFIKFILFLVVLAVAAPFIMKRPDGRPLLTISDITSGDSAIIKSFNTLTSFFRSPKDGLPNGEPSLTTVHKWQDKEGLWHYSDQQPTSTTSQILAINPNQNILEMNDKKLLKILKGEKEETASTTQDLEPPKNMIPGLPSIEQAKKAMDNAKAVQGLLDNHYKQIEKY
ncbi:MAG: hypothetical protein JKY01_08355 [Pseudomonadales bacterium]|nr:hypothetical protein [Pseudomonadales bacterium]